MGDKDKKGKKKAVAVDEGAIDDIFAAPKPKSKKKGAEGKEKKAKVEEAAKRSEVKKVKKEGKEKGEKKKKKVLKEAEEEEPGVEEVVDPSVAVVAALGRAKEARESGKRDRKEVEDDRAWRDSRGDADRKLSALSQADTRQAHGGRILRVQGGRARHRPRGRRHAALPLRLRLLCVSPPDGADPRLLIVQTSCLCLYVLLSHFGSRNHIWRQLHQCGIAHRSSRRRAGGIRR
jgi:hypothetical protein